MKNCQSLHHTKWDCKYHVALISERRKEKIFGVLRKHLYAVSSVMGYIKGKTGISIARNLMGGGRFF
jgi:putative transposase